MITSTNNDISVVYKDPFNSRLNYKVWANVSKLGDYFSEVVFSFNDSLNFAKLNPGNVKRDKTFVVQSGLLMCTVKIIDYQSKKVEYEVGGVLNIRWVFDWMKVKLKVEGIY